jgi:hypothetical protein
MRGCVMRLRFAAIVGVTTMLCGCSAETVERLPTSPTPPPSSTARAFIWVVVVTETGGCVPDATVEIVQGQGVGRRVRQADPCSVWDPDYNATFNDLTAGEASTLRASALGYTTAEKTVVPQGNSPVQFNLSRIQ